MSVADLRNRAKKFLKEKENAVVDAQKKVAKTAMNYLWNYSPHTDATLQKKFEKDKSKKFPGYSSKGEYDANHKVSSESISRSNKTSPTNESSISELFHNNETKKIESLSKIGETLTIENLVEHAKDVEYGGPDWKSRKIPVEGYRTYSIAKRITESIHSGVLKLVMIQIG